jgi:hypothetical protein
MEEERKEEKAGRSLAWLDRESASSHPRNHICLYFKCESFLYHGIFFFLAFINIQNKLPGWRGSSVIEHLIYDPEPGLTPNTRKNKQNPKLYCFET